MTKQRWLRILVSLGLALTLVGAACGDDGDGGVDAGDGTEQTDEGDGGDGGDAAAGGDLEAWCAVATGDDIPSGDDLDTLRNDAPPEIRDAAEAVVNAIEQGDLENEEVSEEFLEFGTFVAENCV